MFVGFLTIIMTFANIDLSMFKPKKQEGPVTGLPMLRVSEVAKLLGVSSEMVRVHERLGRLVSVKLTTGERLFPSWEVERFLKDWRAKAGRGKHRRKGKRT